MESVEDLNVEQQTLAFMEGQPPVMEMLTVMMVVMRIWRLVLVRMQLVLEHIVKTMGFYA